MSTGTPPILPLVLRKYFRFSMSASAMLFSTFPDVGPCKASAATCVGNSLAIEVLLQPRNGAIVDDLAFFVAPAAIDHLNGARLRRRQIRQLLAPALHRHGIPS